MSPTITETFYPKTRSEWREWLSKNHKTKKEIWLIKYKKSSEKPTINYDESVEEALCFGWIDGIERSIDTERYASRFTPRRTKSNWSELNIKRFKKLLAAGQVTEAGHKAFLPTSPTSTTKSSS